MKIRAAIVQRIQHGSLLDLQRAVQSAIELEHATIPLYLTALYSIKPGYNAEAASIVFSVVREEMLHMTIAANLLNAIGGAPQIDKPGFIPVFPGPLPLGIGDLTVGLGKLTRGRVASTFMAIEQPEDEPVVSAQEASNARFTALHAPAPLTKHADYATIGQLYEAIDQRIQHLGEGIFAKPSNPQVVAPTWFPPDQLFPIDSVESATRAIDVIVRQGEGTRTSPSESPGGPPAHYYRFAEIVHARRLVRAQDGSWSYSGAPVPLDPAGVYNLLSDPKGADYTPGSDARALSDRFNYSYTSLLRALHAVFNGRPDQLDAALGLMYEVRLLAGSMAATPIAGTDQMATPTFEYMTKQV